MHGQLGALDHRRSHSQQARPRKFRAYSAGSQPKSEVNPHTLDLLSRLGYDMAGFRSKSWNEFSKPGAPEFDVIITVCDHAAGEACPVWPGKPVTAHWGIADPAAVQGSAAEVESAFKETYDLLSQRVGALASLPIGALDQAGLQSKLREIGRMEGATAMAKAER